MMRQPVNTAYSAAGPRLAARARAGEPPNLGFSGYRYSLFAPPAQRATPVRSSDPYTVRAVAPALRPLVRRYNSRCPECAGPLVSGEGCVACPVCGFAKRG